jgi:hypothetical protein
MSGENAAKEKTRMSTKTEDTMGEIIEQAEEWIPDLGSLDARLRELAKQQPLLCLAVALAGGYVVGRLVSRS